MEITIQKHNNTYASLIYETYTSSTNKKKVFKLVNKSKLRHALSLAWIIIKNYKWLDSSIKSEDIKPKKYLEIYRH